MGPQTAGQSLTKIGRMGLSWDHRPEGVKNVRRHQRKCLAQGVKVAQVFATVTGTQRSFRLTAFAGLGFGVQTKTTEIARIPHRRD